uniref:hypothetical protein n=1 Tax=Paractinoplanes polyasparticus TaxID=2856853 RepID=UPI001C84E52C|nr:hypothetical protein [Actinoplanes polyasparticus]
MVSLNDHATALPGFGETADIVAATSRGDEVAQMVTATAGAGNTDKSGQATA